MLTKNLFTPLLFFSKLHFIWHFKKKKSQKTFMKVKPVLHFKLAGLCTFKISQAHMELCYMWVRLIIWVYPQVRQGVIHGTTLLQPFLVLKKPKQSIPTSIECTLLLWLQKKTTFVKQWCIFLVVSRVTTDGRFSCVSYGRSNMFWSILIMFNIYVWKCDIG